MAKYTLTVPEIKAFQLTFEVAEDGGLWPEWVTDISGIASSPGKYLVQTVDNGLVEVNEDDVLAIGATGTSPFTLSLEDLELHYTEVEE